MSTNNIDPFIWNSLNNTTTINCDELNTATVSNIEFNQLAGIHIDQTIQEQIDAITGGGPNPLQGKWGQFYSTQDQTAAATNTAYTITFNNSDSSNNGVNLAPSSTTRVTFATTGIYYLQYSVQFDKSSASTGTANVWFSKNGTNIDATNSIFTMQGSGAKVIGTVNILLNVIANDYVELKWSVDSTDIILHHDAAASPVPATPSVIFTANQIINTSEGPQGPAGLNGTNGAQGIQGIQGPQGTQGEQGIQGPAGPTGATGPQGPTGAQGPAGKSGLIYYFNYHNTPSLTQPFNLEKTISTGTYSAVSLAPTAYYTWRVKPNFSDTFIFDVGGIYGGVIFAKNSGGTDAKLTIKNIKAQDNTVISSSSDTIVVPTGATTINPYYFNGVCTNTSQITFGASPYNQYFELQFYVETGTIDISFQNEATYSNISFDVPVFIQGPQGIQGPAGPQGPQGIQGPEGPEGPRGPQGPDGNADPIVIAVATAAGTTAGATAGAAAGTAAGAISGATAGTAAGSAAGTTAAETLIATQVTPTLTSLQAKTQNQNAVPTQTTFTGEVKISSGVSTRINLKSDGDASEFADGIHVEGGTTTFDNGFDVTSGTSTFDGALTLNNQLTQNYSSTILTRNAGREVNFNTNTVNYTFQNFKAYGSGTQDYDVRFSINGGVLNTNGEGFLHIYSALTTFEQDADVTGTLYTNSIKSRADDNLYIDTYNVDDDIYIGETLTSGRVLIGRNTLADIVFPNILMNQGTLRANTIMEYDLDELNLNVSAPTLLTSKINIGCQSAYAGEINIGTNTEGEINIGNENQVTLNYGSLQSLSIHQKGVSDVEVAKFEANAFYTNNIAPLTGDLVQIQGDLEVAGTLNLTLASFASLTASDELKVNNIRRNDTGVPLEICNAESNMNIDIGAVATTGAIDIYAGKCVIDRDNSVLQLSKGFELALLNTSETYTSKIYTSSGGQLRLDAGIDRDIDFRSFNTSTNTYELLMTASVGGISMTKQLAVNEIIRQDTANPFKIGDGETTANMDIFASATSGDVDFYGGEIVLSKTTGQLIKTGGSLWIGDDAADSSTKKIRLHVNSSGNQFLDIGTTTNRLQMRIGTTLRYDFNDGDLTLNSGGVMNAPVVRVSNKTELCNYQEVSTTTSLSFPCSEMIFVTGTGNYTITLPEITSTNNLGAKITFIKTNSITNTVTISSTGANRVAAVGSLTGAVSLASLTTTQTTRTYVACPVYSGNYYWREIAPGA